MGGYGQTRHSRRMPTAFSIGVAFASLATLALLTTKHKDMAGYGQKDIPTWMSTMLRVKFVFFVFQKVAQLLSRHSRA